MSLLKYLFLILLYFSVNPQIFSSSFPILPEVQVYHTLGTEGSNYSSGALGIAIHLNYDNLGPSRYLHLLALNIPAKTVGWKSKVGGSFVNENGLGFEIGVHDQWINPVGKGAALTLRKIEWPEIQAENSILEYGVSDILHMGWSWSLSDPIITVWLLGLDLAITNLGFKKIYEIQLALGLRSVF